MNDVVVRYALLFPLTVSLCSHLLKKLECGSFDAMLRNDHDNLEKVMQSFINRSFFFFFFNVAYTLDGTSFFVSQFFGFSHFSFILSFSAFIVETSIKTSIFSWSISLDLVVVGVVGIKYVQIAPIFFSFYSCQFWLLPQWIWWLKTC